MALNSVKSAGTYAYSQVQRQQAERAAQQLEAKARALAAEAASARRFADDAERRAGEIETQADTARGSASTARLAVSSAARLVRAGEALGGQADRIAKSLQSNDKAGVLYGQTGSSTQSSSEVPGSHVSVKV